MRNRDGHDTPRTVPLPAALFPTAEPWHPFADWSQYPIANDVTTPPGGSDPLKGE
jgi:hypothetical protein